jgi:hypothetical protein
MRVAAIAQYGTWSASTRYRLLQHVDRLGQRLGTVDVFLPNSPLHRAEGRVSFFAKHTLHYFGRLHELQRLLPDYDAIFVQRGIYGIGPGLVTLPVRNFEGTVVFDLDDNVFSIKPAFAHRHSLAKWLYGPQQAKAILQRADQVVVSTAGLAEALPGRKAQSEVLPTILDPLKYTVATHTAERRIIGWAGTNGGLTYLDRLREVLERIQGDGTATVNIVSSIPWEGTSQFTLWRLDEEASVFSSFSVGIMPLPDTPFTRAKAGFKLLQYMASGIPVVASPVGVNGQLISDSGAGFVANTDEEWDSSLRLLLSDAKLRQKMGNCGREFVLAYSDLEGQADRLSELLSGTS